MLFLFNLFNLFNLLYTFFFVYFFRDRQNISSPVRAAFLDTLGWITFLSTDDPTQTTTVMALAHENITRGANKVSAQLSQDVAAPSIDNPELVEKSCQIWALLLPQVPSASKIISLSQSTVRPLTFLLSASALEVRVAAGQCVATIFETGRLLSNSTMSTHEVASTDSSHSFPTFDSHFNIKDICEKLNELTNDSSKFKAKKDKTKQRYAFREVLATIENQEYPEETIKLYGEEHTFCSWEELNRVDRLRQALHDGFKIQLEVKYIVKGELKKDKENDICFSI